MPNVIEILLTARDNATKVINTLQDRLMNLSSKLKQLSRSLMQIGAVAGGVFAVVVKATMDAELRAKGLVEEYANVNARQQELLATGMSYAESLKQAAAESGNTAEITGTLNYKMEMLKNTFTDFLVQLGNQSDIGLLIDKLQQLVTWFTNLDPSTKRFIILVIELGVALGALGTVLYTVSSAIKVLAVSVNILTAAVTLLEAHPLIIAFTAIVVIAVLLCDALKTLGDQLIQLDDLLNGGWTDSVFINALLYIVRLLRDVADWLGIVRTQTSALQGLQEGASSVVSTAGKPETQEGVFTTEGGYSSNNQYDEGGNILTRSYGGGGGFMQPVSNAKNTVSNTQFKQLVVKIDNGGKETAYNFDLNKLIKTATHGDMVAAAV